MTGEPDFLALLDPTRSVPENGGMLHRFHLLVDEIRSLSEAARARTEAVLQGVVAVGGWTGELVKVLHLSEFQERVHNLPDPSRQEWEWSYAHALDFHAYPAIALGRLLAAVRGAEMPETAPLLRDEEILGQLLADAGDDLPVRLRNLLVPLQQLGRLDTAILALQYLTEAFPTEHLGEQAFAFHEALRRRLERMAYPASFHPLVAAVVEPLGLQYRPVVYYRSFIDSAEFRFIGHEVGRISLSQRMGENVRPASDRAVVRLERPFFFDLQGLYYAGFAHVARP